MSGGEYGKYGENGLRNAAVIGLLRLDEDQEIPHVNIIIVVCV